MRSDDREEDEVDVFRDARPAIGANRLDMAAGALGVYVPRFGPSGARHTHAAGGLQTTAHEGR